MYLATTVNSENVPKFIANTDYKSDDIRNMAEKYKILKPALRASDISSMPKALRLLWGKTVRLVLEAYSMNTNIEIDGVKKARSIIWNLLMRTSSQEGCVASYLFAMLNINAYGYADGAVKKV